MKQEQELSTFDLEKCIELLKHPKEKVRKWASERLMAFGGEDGRPALLPMIRERQDEMVVPVLDYLSGANFQPAAGEILELFRESAKSEPVRSIRASWCAQALGKLNHQPALPAFAEYIKEHPGDVGLLGICYGLGDIDCPEAREQILGVVKGLEKTRDSGVPYLGDVVVDALLRHGYPEDVGAVLRLQKAWQNEGHKNPRTYSILARTAGENEVYPRLESATLRENIDMAAAVEEQQTVLEISLQEMLGQLVYRGLQGGLEKEQPAEIITWSRQAAEELLLQRYGGLDALRGDEKEPARRYDGEGRVPGLPAKLRDRLSLRILDGLNDPRYHIHHSQMDPMTHKRQALLAICCLLEIAARRDYAELLLKTDSLEGLVEMLTARRWHVPGEVLERAADVLGRDPDARVIEILMQTLKSTEPGYGCMRAARLLGRVRHVPAVPALIGGLVSEHTWMREACREALSRLGPPVLDTLEAGYNAIPPDAWAGVAEVLCRLPYARSAEIAFRAWQDPQVPKTDSLVMVHEKVGSPDSIAYLWEIYQESPKMVGNSLELLCDVYEMDFPELEEVREANRIEEEEQKSYQHGIWQEIRGEAPPQEKFEMILNPDQPKKPAPVQSDKPGRNDACPCGSGKKFKKCCGKK